MFSPFRFLFLLLLTLLSEKSLGQPPKPDVIDSLVQTIKSGYAGYTDKAGDGVAFDRHVERVRAMGIRDTFELMARIALFFQDQHLVMFDRMAAHPVDSTLCRSNLKNIQVLLKRPTDAIEGYWINDLNNCIVGIRKDGLRSYKGYVVESKTKALPGFPLMRFEQTGKDRFLTDFVQERMRFRLFLPATLQADSLLTIDPYGRWRKIPQYVSGTLERYTPFSFVNDMKMLDSHTLLIRLPSFGSKDVAAVDSLLGQYANQLDRINNWIIDLRNNSGGTISVYLPLLPYIATDDIVHCAGFQKVSKTMLVSLATDVEEYRAAGDTVRWKLAVEEHNRLQSHMNELVYFTGDTLFKAGRVYSKPKNVAVIVNRRCLSAAELMLLDLAQSAKVKIFGERTGGAVDYLDAVPVNFPNKSYFLFLATTKRALTKIEPAFDRSGINPQVIIPEGTPDWVEYVKLYYERKE